MVVNLYQNVFIGTMQDCRCKSNVSFWWNFNQTFVETFHSASALLLDNLPLFPVCVCQSWSLQLHIYHLFWSKLKEILEAVNIPVSASVINNWFIDFLPNEKQWSPFLKLDDGYEQNLQQRTDLAYTHARFTFKETPFYRFVTHLYSFAMYIKCVQSFKLNISFKIYSLRASYYVCIFLKA